MIFDAENLFSDGQNLTATGASTNLIDLGATGTPLGAPNALDRELGVGTPISIWVSLDSDAGGTSPTCSVAIQVDDNAAFSSATEVISDAFSTVTAGSVLHIQYLPENVNERYLRLNYTLGGTSPDFTITAGVVAARQTNR